MSTITRAQAKEHLGIGSAATTHDAEIDEFIARAESAVISRCGPLVSTEVTERVDGGRCLVLSTTPIVDLTSVTEVSGSAVDVSGLYVDDSGVVERDNGGQFTARRYTVVYNAGWAEVPNDVPADLVLGVLELVRHLWDTQRPGGARRAGSPPQESVANTLPGAAFLWPFRVEQILAPFMQSGLS